MPRAIYIVNILSFVVLKILPQSSGEKKVAGTHLVAKKPSFFPGPIASVLKK